MWGALCAKHEKKALTVIVDLWRRMYALKCLDEGNVKTHMETLSPMYEQLKGMGEKIEDGNFTMLILASLPKGYCPLINTISLQNHASTTPLKPRVIMESILEEFGCLQIEESQSKATENAMLAKGGKGSHGKELDRPLEVQPTQTSNAGPVERRATTKISALRSPKRNPAEIEGRVRRDRKSVV